MKTKRFFAVFILLLILSPVVFEKRSISSGEPAEKWDASFDIHIEALGGIPPTEEQEITLQATILVKKPLSEDLHFKWILPAEGALVSGELEDSLANVQEGQLVKLQISALGISKESEMALVQLQISSAAAGHRIKGAATFKPE